MSRRIPCPWPDYPEAWIDLPDKWLGDHANRRDEAADKAGEIELRGTLQDFAVSMALLDDWNLPGLTGNPDNWDFEQVDLQIITWVVTATIFDFMKCWAIPKNSLSPSPNGSMETETAKNEEANGPLEAS